MKIEDYERLRTEIKDQLLPLRTQGGKRLFEEVIIMDNPQEPNVDIAAKINYPVIWQDQLIINVERPVLRKFMIPFPWSGDHEQ